MAKYEIMIIADPKEDLKNLESMAKEVFGEELKKFTKMDRINLAYPINKSNIAHYVLIDVETNGELIKEFTRKSNISKKIWRILSINLDTERAMDSLKNMAKFEEWKKRKAAEKEFRKNDSIPKKQYQKKVINE